MLSQSCTSWAVRVVEKTSKPFMIQATHLFPFCSSIAVTLIFEGDAILPRRETSNEVPHGPDAQVMGQLLL